MTAFYDGYYFLCTNGPMMIQLQVEALWWMALFIPYNAEYE